LVGRVHEVPTDPGQHAPPFRHPVSEWKDEG